MRFLRSNTAVIVTVGPFYDKTDGVTIEGALTITNERITLTADTDAGSAPTLILDNVTGATSGTDNDLNYITNTDAGLMQLELSAANTNRVGRMHLTITDAANHVPVFHDFFVLPQAIFDWLTGVIVPLPANVTTWLGTAAATPTTAGIPEVDVTHWNGTAVTTPPAVNTTQISGSAAAADNLEESTEAIAYGTVDGTGATTTAFLTSALTPDSAVNDQFNGRVLIFKNDTTTAALRGQATSISDWAHTSAEIGTFTVVALTTAPQTGDTFTIV